MKYLIKSLTPKILLKAYQKVIYQKKIKAYKGKAVECTICGSKFSIFGSTGVVPRKNAICHRCGSSERHRLIWKYMVDELKLFSQNQRVRLLHFAPEKMFYDLFTEMENVEYVPCDLEPGGYSYTNGPEVIQVDITQIPFDDGSFDFILATHVLEHIPDDHLAMSELYRVMKKGASGIFQVPVDSALDTTYEDFSITSPEGREKAFGQFDHVRWYGRDYKNRLEKVGFKVTEDDYVNRFSKEKQFYFGFMDYEMIYFCKK